jgi:putative heme-binding domain-containing protein
MRRVFFCTILASVVGGAQVPRQNPLAGDPTAAEQGRQMFRRSCALCHGIKGEGGRGPDLTIGNYSAGNSEAALYSLVSGGVAGTEMPGFLGVYNADEIWYLVSYLRSISGSGTGRPTGNRDAGEQLFWVKGQCGQCHIVAGRGKRMGPDLSEAGRHRSAKYLRESVVMPGADLTPGYFTVTIVTKDGKKITGVQRAYDDFSVQLMDAAENYHSFQKDAVTSIQREYRSLMPDTYGKLFSESELDDLVAYLASLRGMRQ